MNEHERALEKDAALRQQIRRVNYILLVVIALLVIVPAAVTWHLSQQYPSVSTISIDGLAMDSPPKLCPGEPFVWRYNFHAAGSGVLVRDKTLWSIKPPRTKIFSAREYFILEGPIDQSLVETWHIPTAYHNPETDRMEPLPPGPYKRLLAISSPTRSNLIAINSVEFEIRADCP